MQIRVMLTLIAMIIGSSLLGFWNLFFVIWNLHALVLCLDT
jgi:hypothetical protein